MTISILPIYAGLLALIYLVLTICTVLARRKYGIARASEIFIALHSYFSWGVGIKSFKPCLWNIECKRKLCFSHCRNGSYNASVINYWTDKFVLGRFLKLFFFFVLFVFFKLVFFVFHFFASTFTTI